MEERLTDLETKISYQDQVIEDLNQVVIELRWTIEKLEKQYKEVESEIKGSNLKDQSLEVPPPHY